MKNFIEDIRDFHRKFGLEYKGKPRQLSPDLFQFRSKFMEEELTEYILAYHEGNLVKQLDSLVDLLYVVFGTAHMHGFNIEEAWRRVHECNMKKDAVLKEGADPRSTRNSSPYDVVKPEGWMPPNLEDLV
jgi:predicted HAD superfamily Cof-like phosphohydrolase